MPSIKTFIVEDSPIILANLTATLEETAPVVVVGHAVDEPTALRGLLQLREDIDLLIVDVFLGVGTGLGVLRGAAEVALRAKRVVLTNYATPAMRTRCRALGADRVFDKSADLEDLILYCTRLANGPLDTVPGALR
jgi:DNA-binding NarL/FixJ family response regulator